jgi:ribosomal-protein-alanine N-acetyltransferase
MEFFKLGPSSAYELSVLDREFGNEAWTESQFDSELNNPLAEIYALKSEGVIVAYGAVRILIDESELLKFYVCPEQRRKLKGKALLSEMIQILLSKGSRVLHLEVRASNLTAIQFYAALGFVNSGRRKNYYKNPSEDAILMHRMLIK